MTTIDETLVSVRCRQCDFTTEVKRSDENRWYEVHQCADEVAPARN